MVDGFLMWFILIHSSSDCLVTFVNLQPSHPHRDTHRHAPLFRYQADEQQGPVTPLRSQQFNDWPQSLSKPQVLDDYIEQFTGAFLLFVFFLYI